MGIRSLTLDVVCSFLITGALWQGSLFAQPIYIYGGKFNLSIPASAASSKGWMADAIVEVPEHHIIHDLDIAVSLAHTSVFDLQIFVQSPSATKLRLNWYDLDEYFKGANYTQVIFDDEAQVRIEDGKAPFTGRFRPKASSRLEVFDGQDCYGLWRLQIYDAFYADTGTLDSFDLLITAPEPTTALLLVLGTAILALYRTRRHP